MRHLTLRRSHASANPFAVLQRPTDLFDHALSAIAFALLIAIWVVVCVAIVPAADVPTHRTHVAEVLRP